MFQMFESQAVLCNSSFPEVAQLRVLIESDFAERIKLLRGIELLQEILITGKAHCLLEDQPLTTAEITLLNGIVEKFEIRRGFKNGTATLWIKSVNEQT